MVERLILPLTWSVFRGHAFIFGGDMGTCHVPPFCPDSHIANVSGCPGVTVGEWDIGWLWSAWKPRLWSYWSMAALHAGQGFSGFCLLRASRADGSSEFFEVWDFYTWTKILKCWLCCCSETRQVEWIHIARMNPSWVLANLVSWLLELGKSADFFATCSVLL